MFFLWKILLLTCYFKWCSAENTPISVSRHKTFPWYYKFPSRLHKMKEIWEIVVSLMGGFTMFALIILCKCCCQQNCQGGSEDPPPSASSYPPNYGTMLAKWQKEVSWKKYQLCVNFVNNNNNKQKPETRGTNRLGNRLLFWGNFREGAVS